jgi:hypothetical protein
MWILKYPGYGFDSLASDETSGWFDPTGKDAEESALAGTGRTSERVNVTRQQTEVEIVEQGKSTVKLVSKTCSRYLHGAPPLTSRLTRRIDTPTGKVT